MSDYTTLADVHNYLSAQANPANDVVLLSMITRISRQFDRETGRPTNFWAAQTGVTRRYSGSGDQWLDLDEYVNLTTVTMSTNQQRSDAITMTLSNDSSMATAPATDPRWQSFAEIYPLIGPPFNQLFLLRGWLPDAYQIGNIAVTGDVITPDEITHAVTTWVVYQFERMRANWADRVSVANGPAVQWSATRPPEVAQVIAYYRDMHRGPKVAMVSAEDTQRISPWLGWRAAP